VRFSHRVVDVKPAFAAGGARLAVSGVDRWHRPTLISASVGVRDVYVIPTEDDSDVIKQ
jgi:hypothetical protein